jgi:prolipoprotein diacylglyceryltransferase
MVGGLAVAFLLRRPSTTPRRWAIWIGALAGAGLGAKLPFLFAGETLLGDGKTLLSGMAGGYLGVELAKLVAGIREKTGDSFAVPLAGAVAVGRWGCFVNGCCGAPWAPIVESAFHGAMALVLWRLEGAAALRTQLLKLYIIAYCVFRFGMEFVRSEPRVLWGTFTPYHLGAVALALLMAALWVVDERRKRTMNPSSSGVV